MALGGFSLYTLSAIRAYVTGESLWSKGQHEAIYFLDLYLDSRNPQHLTRFKRAIDIPLSDHAGRTFLEMASPDVPAATAAFRAAGNVSEDVPRLVWLFLNFQRFPYLQAAVTRWREADRYILELAQLGALAENANGDPHIIALVPRLEAIDAEITPRAIAFSRALGDGARVIESALLIANLVLALCLAALTVWRVERFLRQRREIERDLAWQASHDALTGLLNRRAFEDHLRRAQNARGLGGLRGRALMFIDLDQFKIVNDTCGHAAGDALLRRIGPKLQKLLGPGDVLARLGGDEFGLLLSQIDLASALQRGEMVRLAVESAEFHWKDRCFAVTASIGLVHDEVGAIPPDEMMCAADVACFMAKEKGRNRVHAHGDQDSELLGRVREMNWVQRIHQALADDRFCLYAQEILPLGSDHGGRGLHVELLIRMWEAGDRLVPPASFLPAAERFGLVQLIDRWVVRSAFRTLAMRRALTALPPITCCSINLSGASIGDEAFLKFLKEALSEYKIAPHTICFEVTETSAIVKIDAAQAFIQDLRRLGCLFALDDFGSGMSSFNYLKELPVDFLKIDGGFVRNLLDDPADRAMVEMISHVGHVMGKRIIAECVETPELAHALRAIGVDYGQGFGIAEVKPFGPRFKGRETVEPALPEWRTMLAG